MPAAAKTKLKLDLCREPAADYAARLDPTIVNIARCQYQAGMDFSGVLHKIDLSDPRRVAPAKLRTILRQPLRDR